MKLFRFILAAVFAVATLATTQIAQAKDSLDGLLVEPQVHFNFEHFQGKTDPIEALAKGWSKVVVVDSFDRCWGNRDDYQTLRKFIQDGDKCKHASGEDYTSIIKLSNETLLVWNVPGFIPRGSVLWLDIQADGRIKVMDAVKPEHKEPNPKKKKGTYEYTKTD